jgi:peptidoglycan/LPS O-acetylase OafA/YrhL
MSPTPPARERASGAAPIVPPRIISLDGLRGIAASMVIATHYLNGIERHTFGKAIAPYVGFGATGVDLFFVLSGFLLTGILLDRRHSPNYYSSFYLRRACRIFPLYYALLLAVICVVPLVPSLAADRNFDWGAARIWWFFVYVQNYGMGAISGYMPRLLAPTWSLAVEEQFYALLPFTVRLLSRRALLAAAMLAWAGSLLLRVLIVQSGALPALAASTWSICRLDSLAAGILIALLVRSGVRVSSRALLAAALVLLGLCVVSGPWRSPLLECFSISAVSAGYGCLLLCCIQFPGHPVSAAVSLPVFRWLGKISYGTYLLHAPVRALALAGFHELSTRGVPVPGLLVTPVSLAATIALAYCSWIYYESRFIRWSHSRTSRPIQ